MSGSVIKSLNLVSFKYIDKWQAGFPQGDMQHVNVCLQALLKRLLKGMQRKRKEEERIERERKGGTVDV